MHITFDTHTDVVTVVLRDEPVAESDEQKPGIIFDYDINGNAVAIELLDASMRIAQPNRLTFEVVCDRRES